MHYIVDLRHPLQTPCGGNGRVERAREDIYPVVEAVGMWESRTDFQKVWKGGKPASWLSMLSILCHFHCLLSRWNAGKTIYHHLMQCAALATKNAHRHSSHVDESYKRGMCIGDMSLIEKAYPQALHFLWFTPNPTHAGALGLGPIGTRVVLESLSRPWQR